MKAIPVNRLETMYKKFHANMMGCRGRDKMAAISQMIFPNAFMNGHVWI